MLRYVRRANLKPLLEFAHGQAAGQAQHLEYANPQGIGKRPEEVRLEVLERGPLWLHEESPLVHYLRYFEDKYILSSPERPTTSNNTTRVLESLWRLPDLRQNVLAGIVVGIIALPLSIALAVATGVPPITGLYTAIFAGTVAAVFGGSDFNITGPTAALVPVLSHAVIQHGPEALPLLAAMSGGLLLLMSRVGAGRLLRFIPGTVVVGFTAGIALSIAFGQLNTFFALTGTDPTVEHFHERALDSLAHAATFSPSALAVGCLALGILVAWPRIPTVSRVPGPLIAVVAMTAVTAIAGIDVPTLGSTYGELPRTLPIPTLELNTGLAIDLLPLAVSVAILAGIESLLSAVVADGMSGAPVRHHPDRELRGQGLSNLAAALFGGMPATAAIARTAAGIRSGGTNRITGVVHALTVLTATLALGGLAGRVPLSALAAILLVIAWNIADVREVVKLLRRAPLEDAAILAATMLITLFLDITYAVAFGVIASAILLLRQLMRIPVASELLPDPTGRIPAVSRELGELIQQRPDITFFTAGGLLSFHSAAAFEFELSGRSVGPLILRMKDVHYIDTTGLLRLEAIVDHRQKHGGRMILTALRPEVSATLERFGILDKLGRDNVFEHTRCAIASLDAPAGHDLHPGPHPTAPAQSPTERLGPAI